MTRRDDRAFGDSQDDIRAELLRYSERNDPAHHFADVTCTCGSRDFHLFVDDTEGAAVRVCLSCGGDHPIGDSVEYLDDAELGECECPCGQGSFELTVGVSLDEGTEEVRRIDLGCRCPACGLIACYGDWKVGGGDYRELLGQA